MVKVNFMVISMNKMIAIRVMDMTTVIAIKVMDTDKIPVVMWTILEIVIMVNHMDLATLMDMVNLKEKFTLLGMATLTDMVTLIMKLGIAVIQLAKLVS